MERIYLALMRLASATLLCGLIIVAMIALNSGQLYQNYVLSASGTFFDTLRNALPGILITSVTFLMDGVALLGIVVAWANRRGAWMLALIAAAVVAIVFPAALMFGGDFFAIHPRIGRLIAQNATLLIFLPSLIPVALALVMALRRGGGRAAMRAEADAALGLTRSRL